MEENFDLEKFGRRMPYTVPEGFFEQMEETLKRTVSDSDKKKNSAENKTKHRKLIYRIAATVAAVVLLTVIVRVFWPTTESSGSSNEQVELAFNQLSEEESFKQVELAFNQLSEEDQDLLLEIYEDDVFLYQ
jgi:C4-type Zn-finger protein